MHTSCNSLLTRSQMLMEGMNFKGPKVVDCLVCINIQVIFAVLHGSRVSFFLLPVVCYREVLGGTHTKQTGLKQLVSCSAKLQLHETDTLIPDVRKAKCRTEYRARNFSCLKVYAFCFSHIRNQSNSFVQL